MRIEMSGSLIGGLALILAGAVAAAPAVAAAAKAPTADTGGFPVTTKHALRLAGGTLRYTAVLGRMTLRDENGKATARMSYIAYTGNGANEADQPITFIYGGGPGATSTGLQMVGFGPMRVITTNAAYTPGAPYKIVDNKYTLLNATDIVYVEEVGAGFSRLMNGTKLTRFAGVDEDAHSFRQFVVRYLNKYHRWNSPKYLMGNSYGTTRDAVLANDLQGDGVDLRGVILISTVLNFQTLAFGPGNELPYILFLPTYSAVAWYHHALSPAVQGKPLSDLLGKVQSFTIGPYATFLREGDAASDADKADIARKLAGFTGLSETYIRYNDYRVRPTYFRKELLRSRNEVVGRMGGRFKGMDYNQASAGAEYDPIDPAIGGAYTASMNYYLRHVLDYDGSELWRMEAPNAFELWDWRNSGRGRGGFHQGYVDVSKDLRQAMIDNPSLKVFVACGYYDLATPYFAMEYTFNHMRLGTLRNNVTTHCYKSGHVMYLHPQSLVKIHKDLEDFYTLSH